MQTSNELQELVVALVKAQEEFTPAIKNSINPAYKSKYLDLTGAIDATRPALLKNGLVVVQGIAGDIEAQSITCCTRLMHVSGQFIESELTLPALQRNNFDAQAVGSASTYARRYSYMAMLGISGDDDDGNAAVADKPVVQPIVAIKTPPIAYGLQKQLKASLEITDSDLPPMNEDLAFLNDDSHPSEIAAPPVRRAQPPLIAHPPAPPAPVTRAAAAKSHSVGSVKVISPKQASRLWAISKGRNIAPGDVNGIVRKHGFDSVENIDWRSYEAIVSEIEAV